MKCRCEPCGDFCKCSCHDDNRGEPPRDQDPVAPSVVTSLALQEAGGVIELQHEWSHH
jgi:hypothetical protein